VTLTTPIRGSLSSQALDIFYLQTKFGDSHFSRSGNTIASIKTEMGNVKLTMTLLRWTVIIPLKFGLKVIHPPFEHRNFDQCPLIAPQPWELAKKVQLVLIGSRPCAFQRAVDEPCTLPLSPPTGGTKRDFAIFSSKFQLLSNKVSYKVSWCENFQRKSCSYIIPLSNSP